MEIPSFEHKKKLLADLEQIQKEEDYARGTVRLLELARAEHERDRIKRELRTWKKETIAKELQLILGGIGSMRHAPLRNETGQFLGALFSDYIGTGSVGDTHIIDTPVDKKIPRQDTLKNHITYLGVAGLLPATFGFIGKEFGEKTESELVKLLTDLIGFYIDSGSVYGSTQTYFIDKEKTRSSTLKPLKLFEVGKNYLPSMHVEFMVHISNRAGQIIDRLGENSEEFKSFKDYLSNRVLEITEACLLLKHHSVRDISASLAAISVRDQTFDAKKAAEFTNGLFSVNQHELDQGLITEIRSSVVQHYEEIMSEVGKVGSENYTSVLVNYIKSLPQKTSGQELQDLEQL